jgi:chitodextrinase
MNIYMAIKAGTGRATGLSTVYCKRMEQRNASTTKNMKLIQTANATMKQLALLLSMLLAGLTTHVSAVIIPANRTVDWSASRVGVPGGIPHRGTVYQTFSAGTAASTIQNAINSCPDNQVIQLGPGTFDLGSGLQFGFGRNNVTLRGSGSGTVLRYTGGTVLTIGAGALWNTANHPPTWDAGVSISSGNTQGSSNLVVSSTVGLTVGQLVTVDEQNDPTWVFDTSDSTPRALGQTAVVQSINGNTVTIWPPLLVDFNTGSDPRLKTLGSASYQVQYDGIEDLVIDGSTSSAPTGMMMENCYGCWLSNVTFKLIANYNCTVYDSSRCTFSHCSFLDSPTHTSNHYGLGFEQRVCSSLVENCIMKGIFPGMEINYGSSGNVVAYNFMFDSYQDGYGNGVTLDCNHGPHNMMNLFEGNVLSEFQSDGYFGSSSHMTLFRNWVMGWGPTYGAATPINLNRWSWYFNVVGNLLGTNGAQSVYDFNGSSRGVYELGYPNMGNDGYTGTAPPGVWSNPGSSPSVNQYLDLLVKTNILRTINWDVVSKAVVYDPTIADRSLPGSYYLNSKPAWFGNLNWPPFDPTTVNAAMLSPTNIPAGYRYAFGVDPPSGPPDTTAPSAPGSLAAVAAGGTQINLNWSASSDNVGVTGYLVERQPSGGSFTQVGTPTAITFSDTGLTAGTTYSYRVRAKDAVGNLSAYSSVASATTTAADTQPPSVPSNLSVTAAGSTNINVTWTASTDNVGVTGYRVERSQGTGSTTYTQVGTPSTASFNDVGLLPSTVYNYRVRATDAIGNLSGYSTVATATTANPPPDQIAPSVPSGVSALTVSSNQITVTWTSSSDNVAVTGYRIERSQGSGSTTFTQVGAPSTTSFSDSGLSALTIYNYRVRATDSAGNLSAYSVVATATTASPTAIPGLVAAYGFEEGRGSTAADSSGNGNTAAITAATWAMGKYGNALSFDGVNAVVLANDSSSLGLTSGMTLEAWVNPSAINGNWQSLVVKPMDPNFTAVSYVLQGASRSSGVPSVAVSASSSNLFGPATLPLNTWSHVAATYDGTTIRLYVNGVVVASQAQSGAISTSAEPLRIGAGWPGLIDEVRVYNRALSVSEIQQDLNNSVMSKPAAPTGLHVVVGP